MGLWVRMRSGNRQDGYNASGSCSRSVAGAAATRYRSLCLAAWRLQEPGRRGRRAQQFPDRSDYRPRDLGGRSNRSLYFGEPLSLSLSLRDGVQTFREFLPVPVHCVRGPYVALIGYEGNRMAVEDFMWNRHLGIDAIAWCGGRLVSEEES